MPQMMPMNWMLLSLSFTLMIILMIIMLYFTFNSNPMSSKIFKTTHNKFNMPW